MAATHNCPKVCFPLEVRVESCWNMVVDLGPDAFGGVGGTRIPLGIKNRNPRPGALEPLNANERFVEQSEFATKYFSGFGGAVGFFAGLCALRLIRPFELVLKLRDADAQGFDGGILFFNLELVLPNGLVEQREYCCVQMLIYVSNLQPLACWWGCRYR